METERDAGEGSPVRGVLGTGAGQHAKPEAAEEGAAAALLGYEFENRGNG